MALHSNNRPQNALVKPIALFNAGQLADYLGRSAGYVSAMKKAGFKFSHGTKTFPKAALEWLAANPDFRVASVYPSKLNRKLRPQKPPPKT